MDPIAPDWLDRPVETVAPDLIGCTLVRRLPQGDLLRAVIVETEAYGPGDPACHGYRRQTPRNQAMFAGAGVAYVYQIYGIYFCLNVVTGVAGVASGVLIRAVTLTQWPQGWLAPWGIPDDRPNDRPEDCPENLPNDRPEDRRNNCPSDPTTLSPAALRSFHRLGAGPGKLCRLLHIDRTFNQIPLTPNHPLWLEHRPPKVDRPTLHQTTRIGLSQGQDLPWRWYQAHSPAISRP